MVNELGGTLPRNRGGRAEVGLVAVLADGAPQHLRILGDIGDEEPLAPPASCKTLSDMLIISSQGFLKQIRSALKLAPLDMVGGCAGIAIELIIIRIVRLFWRASCCRARAMTRSPVTETYLRRRGTPLGTPAAH